jgi:hypothetical protein
MNLQAVGHAVAHWAFREELPSGSGAGSGTSAPYREPIWLSAARSS